MECLPIQEVQDIGDSPVDFFTTPAIGTPQLITGTFTAADTDQILYFNGSADLGYLNAFQLRNVTAVPEPATMGLWLIAFGLGAYYRRKIAQSASR